MAKEYIECEVAKARLRMWITDCLLDGDNETADRFRECIDLLDSIPAADVAPVRHGKWVHSEIEDDDWGRTFHEWTCSVCGYSVAHNPTGENYCPNCGAYMMGENNGKCE